MRIFSTFILLCIAAVSSAQVVTSVSVSNGSGNSSYGSGVGRGTTVDMTHMTYTAYTNINTNTYASFIEHESANKSFTFTLRLGYVATPTHCQFVYWHEEHYTASVSEGAGTGSYPSATATASGIYSSASASHLGWNYNLTTSSAGDNYSTATNGEFDWVPDGTGGMTATFTVPGNTITAQSDVINSVYGGPATVASASVTHSFGFAVSVPSDTTVNNRGTGRTKMVQVVFPQ